ncbi:hypothetical protein [Paenibacillus naphthalenovorans]|uniref:Uncharacterized protein n=1 Tax=Paenibacillus naphthalenovorans TaxID=162209 RepID=A0A0U2W1B1_9BACL|nr:hypothetical protein [Paenibacillus naphthalenovorans]ALS22324.1 hypothetical protein IJ22_19500 [Paenibacillus naphthalenovorans]
MIQQYVQYNNPVTIVWRKGTPDDPYVDKADSLKIINNMIILTEIPAETFKVNISGLIEVDKSNFERKKELLPNEYLVHYSNGIVQFHPSQEFNTVYASYKGRGMILYPASRIISYNKDAPFAEKNLQEIIDEIYQSISKNQKLIDDLQVVTQNAINATNNANTATDGANVARDEAIDAKNEALFAASSTIMIYKEPVDTYDDLDIVYSNPENGWRVTVNDTGDVYRYDGFSDSWVFLGNSIGSLPIASDISTGLLDKEDYKQFTVRSIVFAMPKILSDGIQNYIVQFPFEGQIIKAYAFCVGEGTVAPLELAIEKISSNEFDNSGAWQSIFNQNIFINPNQTKGTTPVLKTNNVNKNDYFRVNVLQLDNNIRGVTVQLDIKIK